MATKLDNFGDSLMPARILESVPTGMPVRSESSSLVIFRSLLICLILLM